MILAPMPPKASARDLTIQVIVSQSVALSCGFVSTCDFFAKSGIFHDSPPMLQKSPGFSPPANYVFFANARGLCAPHEQVSAVARQSGSIPRDICPVDGLATALVQSGFQRKSGSRFLRSGLGDAATECGSSHACGEVDG
jgi:hypothetical protein